MERDTIFDDTPIVDNSFYKYVGEKLIVVMKRPQKPLDVEALSDSFAGIGFDQCILIEDISFKICIFNKDGSKASFSNEGFSCLADFLYRHTNKTRFNIEIGLNKITLYNDAVFKPRLIIKGILL